MVGVVVVPPLPDDEPLPALDPEDFDPVPVDELPDPLLDECDAVRCDAVWWVVAAVKVEALVRVVDEVEDTVEDPVEVEVEVATCLD